MIPVGALLLVASVCGPLGSLPGPDPAAVFEKHRSEFVRPGVHQADGFVFAAACASVLQSSSTIAERMARADALGAIARMRVSRALGSGAADASAKGRALFEFGASVAGSQELSGVIAVHAAREGDQACVVIAVPTPLPLDADDLRSRIAARLRDAVEAGNASVPESLLLLELDPSASDGPMRSAVLGCLDRGCGDGLGASIEHRWTTRDGMPLQDGLKGWCVGVDGRQPVSAWTELKPIERLRALGSRAGDPVLMALVRSDMATEGWARMAALLGNSGPSPSPIPASPADSRLEPAVRRQLLSTPMVVAVLLSRGSGEKLFRPTAAVADDARAEFVAARTVFLANTDPASLNAVAARLTSVLGSKDAPQVDASTLLASTVLALGEPVIAEALAAAAFRVDPTHAYAGVNLLLAQRALGDRAKAANTLPAVEAAARLDDWGREQVGVIRSWLQG
jgi:hypothetical protein